MTDTLQYSLEGAIQQRGDRVRIWLRLCSGSRVIGAFKQTFGGSASVLSVLLAVKEAIPKEFDGHPGIQREILDPIEEMWRHRVMHGGGF